MAADEEDATMREYVAQTLAKLVSHEAEKEKEMQAKTAESPAVKRQKRLKRPSMNGLFLQAILDNAPTEEGKRFVMEDIYSAIKGSAEDVGEDQEGLLEKGEDEEAREIEKDCKYEFHALTLLAQCYENLLILPSKSRILKCADFAVMARSKPDNTDPHPSRLDDIDNEYYPEVEAANRSRQARVKEEAMPSSTVTDIPRL
jgi:hypothetical protein